MKDQELITAVKRSVSAVQMNVPAEQIVRRSRAIRARRRIPVAAGTLAVAAGVALAVTTLVPSGPASHPSTTQLAAWTVSRQANGDILVTLRELRDPAGLQRTLRADGVPATVTFAGQRNPACRNYPIGGGQSQRTQLLSSVVTRERPHGLVIHPSALPSGAGLQIYTLVPNYPAPQGPSLIAVGLVQASPQCTGS